MVNIDGFSALHYATVRGLAKFVTKLVDSGADINLRSVSGFNPLSQAESFLLFAHADPIEFKKRTGLSSINMLYQTIFNLIKRGASMSKLDIFTLFYVADREGNSQKQNILAALEGSAEMRNEATKREYLDWVESLDPIDDMEEFLKKQSNLNPRQFDFSSTTSTELTSITPFLAAQGSDFMELYGTAISLLNDQPLAPSWAQLRLQLGLGLAVEAEAEANEEKEDAMIQRAMVAQLAAGRLTAAEEDDEDGIFHGDASSDFGGDLSPHEDDHTTGSAKVAQKIELSQQVVKWWNGADDKYKMKFNHIQRRWRKDDAATPSASDFRTASGPSTSPSCMAIVFYGLR